MALFKDKAAAEDQKDFTCAQVLLGADGTRCFLCGGALGGSADQGYPVIYWRGFGGDIHWHASCAADFTFRIAQDVQALKHDLSMHLAFEPDTIDPGGLSGTS